MGPWSDIHTLIDLCIPSLQSLIVGHASLNQVSDAGMQRADFLTGNQTLCCNFEFDQVSQ